MIICIKDVWDDARNHHSRYVHALIAKALAGPPDQLCSVQLRRLLESDASDLAVGGPGVLRKLIGAVEDSLGGATEAERHRFNKEATTIFDYDRFAAKTTKGWNAYGLCRLSRHRLCPYCQQAYAFTVERTADKKSFRPTLDHFYPKTEYPYLGLSLFNLVPSCQVCNSSLKHDADFYKLPHLHPLEDEEHLRFDFDVNNYLMSKEYPNVDVGIEVINDGHLQAAENSISTFLLRERIEPHRREFTRFLENLYRWTPDAVDGWNRTTGETSQRTEASLLQFDLATYRLEHFGRIKRDLYYSVRNAEKAQAIKLR